MAAENLAVIAGINTEEFAKNMFRAGSDFGTQSPEAIFYQDFKTFFAAEREFGVGQIIAMSQDELDAVKDRLIPYMEKVVVEKGLRMVYLLLTNILEESTDLLFAGPEALRFAERAFGVKLEPGQNSLFLKGVVSRKKQFLPAIIEAMQVQEEPVDA
jgi:manganese-dependent inorganic pyrophosphatase